MNKKAAWIVIVSAIAVFSSGVEGTARTCYFGPPPKPDPDNPDHWMKQVMRETRERCPGKGACSQAERVECANPRPLGMEDGSIPDANISASSMYGGWPPQAARLNGDRAWSAAAKNGINQWIEVDLGERTVVSGVITQGDPGGDWWVTKYKVSYQKQPSSERTHVKDRHGNIVVFAGNTDRNTPVTNLFNEGVVATTVRIEPTEWHNWLDLRFELLGCHRG